MPLFIIHFNEYLFYFQTFVISRSREYSLLTNVSKVCDKLDDFHFAIVYVLFLYDYVPRRPFYCNVPLRPSYGVCIRFAKTSSRVSDF